MIAHRVERFGPWLAAIGVGMAFVLFLGGGIYSVHHQRGVDQKLCKVTTENRDSTRASWEAVRGALLRSVEESDDSEAEKARVRIRYNAFIDEVLRPIPPLKCVNNQPVPVS